MFYTWNKPLAILKVYLKFTCCVSTTVNKDKFKEFGAFIKLVQNINNISENAHNENMAQ